MRKPSRLLRVIGAAGLLISLLAATIAPVTAQDEGSSQDFLDTLIGSENAGFLVGTNAIYYPWVSNDDDFGLGPADTSISVQNLEDRDTIISIFVGDGAGGFDLATSAFLSAYAAKTFHASALGIAEGSGAPVQVVSFNSFSVTGFPAAAGVPAAAFDGLPGNAIALVETPVILSNPVADDEDDGENDGGTFTQVVVCVVNYHTSAQPLLGNPWGYVNAQTGAWVSYSTQAELQATLNEVNEGNLGELINPFGGLNNDGDCFDVLDAETLEFDDSVAIGGVAKQAVDGEALPYTSGADTAVSGYNAINGVEMAYFDEWYLPIVQTNCGPGGCWDSMLRIANYDSMNNAVTVRFFPADDGSGSLQTGFQLQALVNGGDTWSINLGDHVPDGWVGSAHILSDGAVFAMVDRYKVGYDMWITNTGSSADFENIAQVPGSNGRYVLFAPHVLLDYFGWNTGINVANLVATDNNISIQYFNLFGNATQVLNQRLAAHGMTYFYDPSVAAQDNNSQDVTSDPNAGVVGSALIWSQYPVAAAIDATKYPETDPNGGADLFQATSYSATANVFPWQAVPLVQKGSAADGMGDTSGINIMNPNAVAATANVYWVNPSGFLADNFGTSSVTIPAFANGFVYTLWQHNLPNGFLGAAQVVANVPVAAVSANVNYAVDGDGSAIFNAFNPCGLYRVSGACTFGDVFAPGGQSVTKTFISPGFDAVDDDDDIPVMGVNFSIYSTSGAGFQRDGVSGTNGSMTFSNVPVGTYELVVNDVPAGYVLPEGVVDSFVVSEGQDVVLVNELEWDQSFEKFVCVTGTLVVDDDEVAVGCDEPLAGINVTVYTNIGTTTSGGAVAGTVVFEGETGADGSAGRTAAVGDYIVCIWDEDGEAVTANGETVLVDLPDDGSFGAAVCETFSVAAGEEVIIYNEVDILEGVLNVFVSTGDGDATGSVLAQAGDNGVAGVEVCLIETGECPLTNAGGFVEFTEVPEGSYTIEVQADGSTVVMVEGGVLTVSNEMLVEDGLPETPAVITFDYSPTEDLVQDGWVDDVDDETLVGSIGLNIELTGIGSLVKYVCDENNTVLDSCQAAQNEIQEITPFIPQAFIDCGGFSISFGDPPNNSAFFGSNCEATPAEIEAGMVAQIDALVAGDIIVSGGPLYGVDTAPVLIEFTGNYASQDVPLLQVSATGTAGGGDVSTIQEAAVSAVVPGGTVQVFVALPGSDLGDDTTWGPEVTAGPQPTDADGRFELAGLGEGTYIVCADAPTAVAEVCEFADVVEGEETLLVNNIDILGSMDVVNEEQNEIQSITTTAATNDPITLIFETEETDPFGARESAIVVQAALEANSNIGAGNVSCTGTLNFFDTVTCEFIGTLAGQNFDEMTFGTAPPLGTIETDQDGGTSATISADAFVSGGTFTLTFAAETTAPIDWDASAAEVQAALEALSTIGAGNVSVSGGDLPGADVVVLFTGTLAGTSEDLTIDDSNIT